jgi:outer membrane protein assembly factor BamB
MKVSYLMPMLVLSLTACSSWLGDKPKDPLPGERLSVMQLQKTLEPENTALKGEGFVAPAPWTNEFWPQVGGYSNHAMQHLELAPEPRKIWSIDIGSGSTKTNPLTAQPIIVDNRVYALDTDGQLSAFDAETGKRLWKIFVGATDEDDTVIGGGLAFSNGTLYVTNGYDELLALKPDDGTQFWRVKLPAPARAAPTILDQRVFVVTLDNRLIALDAQDGKALWTYRGVNENAGLLGAASPAVNRDIVIAPFSSGEIFAIRIENGSVAWSDNLAPPLRLGGVGGLADIRALPVMDRGLVIAMSYAGRLVAIDERSGARVWQRDIGGEETPWVAGNTLFVLTKDAQLVALGRDNGAIRWVTQLDRFEDATMREGTIVWTGPVLAGGRLIVAGSKGRMLDIAPDTGKINRSWSVKDTPAVPLSIANKTLYVLTRDGTLSAWR